MIRVSPLVPGDGRSRLPAADTRIAIARTTDAETLAAHAATLPGEVQALAATYATESRRAGFLGGRVALRAALAEAGCAEASRAVLRDARGRPVASWPDAPPFSIAHTRRRAIALVASRGVAAVGVDIEEIDARRAEALVRKAFSGPELALLADAAPSPAATPHPIDEAIAAWCAREACVKAHALEVGWFGTALEIRAFECVPPPAHVPGEAAWRVTIAHVATRGAPESAPLEPSAAPLEPLSAPRGASSAPLEASSAPLEPLTAPLEASSAPLEAYAWREEGAILAVAWRA